MAVVCRAASMVISLYFSFTKLGNNDSYLTLFICLFCALRPKSTAVAMVGRSVHLTDKPDQAVNQYFVNIYSRNKETQQAKI